MAGVYEAQSRTQRRAWGPARKKQLTQPGRMSPSAPFNAALQTALVDVAPDAGQEVTGIRSR